MEAFSNKQQLYYLGNLPIISAKLILSIPSFFPSENDGLDLQVFVLRNQEV